MCFADKFVDKMDAIRSARNNRLASLKTSMMNAIDERDSHQAAADSALTKGAVSAVVESRIMVDKKNKEYEVYGDLMNATQNKMPFTTAEYNTYLEQIRSEYHKRECAGYKSLLEALNSVRSVLDEINSIDAEAHYCYNSLTAVIDETGNIEKYNNGRNPFEWEFSLNRFIEEPLRDVDIRMIKAKIQELSKYMG